MTSYTDIQETKRDFLKINHQKIFLKTILKAISCKGHPKKTSQN